MDSKTPDASVPPLSAMTEHMAERQVRKLDLEIKELSRPWWQKPAFLSALFPLFVGVLAVFVAYNRGFFDTQAALLELKRERLQRDVETFTTERNRLITDNKNLLQKNAELTAERGRLLADQGRQAALIESQRYALSGQLALITLRENIKELSHAIGTKDSTLPRINLTLLTGTYSLASNPFYQTIVSELKRNDGHQQDRIKLISQEVETQDGNPLLRGFLLVALAEVTKDSSWRDKLFKLTIDNEFRASSLGSPFLYLVIQGPFTISEKASVLMQLAKSVRDRKTDSHLEDNKPYQLFLIANQSPDVLDACVPSPLVDAIRFNRDRLLADMNFAVTQETEELKREAFKLFDVGFDLHWPYIAELSPQAALVYLAQIALKTRRNMLTGRPLELEGGAQIAFSPSWMAAAASMKFRLKSLKSALSPWPGPPFPPQTEISQLTSQHWADWLKQNRQIAEVWLDQQLIVISRNGTLLRKVNRRQSLEANEIP